MILINVQKAFDMTDHKQKQSSRSFSKTLFLKVSQNLHENACARVFINKVAGWGL